MTGKLLWQPDEAFVQQSNLQQFMNWLQIERRLTFDSYDALWQWSIDDTRAFWQAIWDYFAIISHSPYEYVHSDDPMPDTRWFAGSTLNYAEHIFRSANGDHPAIIFRSERQELLEISWATLRNQVASVRQTLLEAGVGKGDCVVAYLPNIPEATVAFLATCSLGAIWSSCSPDFGAKSVIDRFQQIEPKVLIAVDGYQYNGKPFDKSDTIADLKQQLSTVETVVMVPYLNQDPDVRRLGNVVWWSDAIADENAPLDFAAVPFEHPIWVLYSSGTTGIPKAITHSQGGVLLEHYKYLAFHNDVHPGERFFWYSTTGWMMWNFVQASLLVGATIVLYDGAPNFPDLNGLWQFAEESGIHHFGTSAPFIVACLKAGLSPGNQYKLTQIRSIGSTGAPLPPEGFDWIYEHIGKHIWLCSMSGGTDVCTAWVGGCPTEPVYLGEIQRRCLGCSMYAFNDAAEAIVDEVGEMVVTRPMPSMPIYFWNDESKKRYRESYFEMFPDIWRHGDWLSITARNTLMIHGRSDATLNRHGVRIGTAEIYRAVDKVRAVKDSLIVNLERANGDHYMPLFVLLNDGVELDEALRREINQTLRSEYSPRHVPDEIIEVGDIPYTISGKKLESPVKKILMGMDVEKAANPDSMRNPDSLGFFVDFRERLTK